MVGQTGLPAYAVGDVFDKYTIVRKLGEGGFGAVYHVNDEAGLPYAAKMESVKIKTTVITMETAILEKFNKRPNKHFCSYYGTGKQPGFRYIIMSLTWKSLQDLRKERVQQCFTPGTSIRLGIQCLEGLEELHAAGFLHRDVKPGNYSVGRKEDGKHKIIYLLDFGLSRRYVSGKDNHFRTPRKRAAFRGTLRYAPIVCHRQEEFGPKDDVESWVYMLIEMTKAALPWKAITDKPGVTVWKENVRDTQHTRRHLLFADVPPEYQQMFALIENLTYFDLAPYQSMYELMRVVQDRLQVVDDDPFDWETVDGKASSKTRRARAPSTHRNVVEDDTNHLDKTTVPKTNTVERSPKPLASAHSVVILPPAPPPNKSATRL